MAAVDPFLCVGMAILLAILLVINVYMLVMWQHPDDKVIYQSINTINNN
jgi:hypothetical protein